MISRIYWGEVKHWRASPKEHCFSYPTFNFALNLDQIDSLQRPLLFGLNRVAFYSIYERDYLKERTGRIREKLNRFLEEKKFSSDAAQVLFITTPRMFGYVFNPVSFYIGLNNDQKIIFLIAEVNNTFGEKHLYLLEGDSKYEFDKEFFVSPFFAVAGNYQLSVDKLGEELSITVNLFRDNKLVFSAVLQAKGIPFTTVGLLKTFIRYPLNPLLVMFRIHFEAYRLYFKKAAEAFIKPKLTSLNTVRSRQNIFHRLRLALIEKLRNKGVDELPR